MITAEENRRILASGLGAQSLLAATGLRNDLIGARLNVPRQIVSKWRKRFFHDRLAGLDEEPRGGRRAAFPPASSLR